MEEVLQKLLGLLDRLTEERGVPAGDASIDKNIVKSPNSTLDNGKKTSGNITSNERKRLKETFSLFNKMFFDYKKKEEPDKKERTKLSELSKKQVTPLKQPSEKSKGGFGGILGGLLLLVGGLAAFVTGLMNDGPFKGILKLLSKVGIQGGIALLKKAVKPFLESVGKILKFPAKILGKMGNFLSKGFRKIGKFIIEGVEKLGGKSLTKAMSKLASGGFGKMIGKFLKGFAKVFKKLPIVGTLITLGFAISRFRSGDIVGGTIEVLSGLATLVPVVGTGISIGLDVLNAVLDSKADNGPGKPKTSKLDILKDMASSIGTWIWDRRQYIPILAPISRFMDAWGFFKSGNISEGLSNLGWGLASLLTGGDAEVMLKGIGAFMGFFDSTPTEEGEKPKANGSFLKDISAIMMDKIASIGTWLKEMITKGIVEYIPGGQKILDFGKDFVAEAKDLYGKVSTRAVEFGKDFVSESKAVGKEIWTAMEPTVGRMVEFGKDFVSETKAMGGKLWDGVTSVTGGLVDSVKGMLKSSGDGINSMVEEAKDAILPEGDTDPLSLLGKSILSMMGKKPRGEQTGTNAVDPANPANTTNPTNNQANPTNTVSGNTPTDVATMLNKNTTEGKDMFDKLYQANLITNQLLTIIANNTAKAFSGGGGSVHQTVMAPPTAPQKETPMVNMPSNRGSFLASPYAI